MAPLNLDQVTGFSLLEPMTPAPGPPGIDTTGRGSFGEHLQRARQSVGVTTDGDRGPVDSARPSDPQAPPAANDPQAATTGSQAAQSDEGTAGKTEPDGAAANRPEATEPSSDADEATGSQEADATSRQEGEEDDGNPTDAGADAGADAAAATAEPHPAENGSNTAGSLESVGKGGIPVEGLTPAENANGSQGEGQEEVQQSARPPAVPLKPQANDGSVPADKSLPGEPEEQGRAGGQTTPEESTPAASQTDDGKATQQIDVSTAAESGDRQAGGVAVASGPNGPRPDNPLSEAQRPERGSRRRATRQGAGRPVAARSNNPASAGSAQSAEAGGTEQNATANAVLSARDLVAVSGDESARAVSTGSSQGETGPATRVASSQDPRPAPAEPNQSASLPEHVDRVRFVQRVARAFEAIGDRGGSVRLRLHPPELGSLRLEATIRNGAMTVRLEAETEAARSILLDNLPALRDRLAGQDIRIQRFDVDLSDRSFGGSAEQAGGDPQSHDHPKDNAPPSDSDQRLETDRPPQPGAATEPGRGNQLDVII